MTEAAKELWWHRINQIRLQRQKQYKHHPLEERAVLIPKK